MSLTRLAVPCPSLLEEAALEILRIQGDKGLGEALVLVPNHHSGRILCRRWHLLLGGRASFLPQIKTLEELALDADFSPDSCRASQLYGALRDKGWFRDADLWRVTFELLALFDEMNRHRVFLPSSLPEFSKELEKAYQIRGGDAMAFEARLVHELWHAMEAAGAPSKSASYPLALSGIAQNASAPLYAVGLQGLIETEEEFFARYAKNADVHLFSEEFSQGTAAFLRSAWIEDFPELKRRAAHYSGKESPLALSVFAAKSLEEEAEGAEARIRQWLFEGKKDIAVVVQDRLVARRVRALLERAQILVSDETGWTFSTTSASTVVMRFLEAVSSDFYHRDLLDLFKSPFIFSDWEKEKRKSLVFSLEKWVRENKVLSGLANYFRLARHDPEVNGALMRLEGAAKMLTGKKRTLSGWLAALESALNELGVTQALISDRAGAQLLQAINRLSAELGREKEKFSFSQWRMWLDLQMERMTFRDASVQSPVSFTHLAATRLRSFDAAIVLGADASHFPSKEKADFFFNRQVRRELKLPTGESERAQQISDLIGLFCRSGELWVSFQRLKEGEENLLSPMMERLQAFHFQAFGADLSDEKTAAMIPAMRLGSSHNISGLSRQPRPAIPETLIPTTISASAYNALMACPYQYYARHVLKLNELEETEEKLGKADFGVHVHKILQIFHDKFPLLSSLDREFAESQLGLVSDAVFREAVEIDYLNHAWALRWKKLISPYVAWQIEREKEGFRIAFLEERREVFLEKVTLKGRLDRIDRKAGELFILDYKTQAAQRLAAKISDPGEDVQLPFYALLVNEAVANAAFLSLEKDRVALIEASGADLENWADLAKQRLLTVFGQIHEGASLPAQGTDAECAYCEMSGLCRKGYWA